MINVSNDKQRDNIISDLLPDLTPLLDIMFMLIVFLILTTNPVQEAFEVNLPKNQEDVLKNISEKDVIKVTIFAEQRKWAVNEQKFADFTIFKQNLLDNYQNSESKHVVIFSDQEVTVDRLLKLLTFMSAEGVEVADIVME